MRYDGMWLCDVVALGLEGKRGRGNLFVGRVLILLLAQSHDLLPPHEDGLRGLSVFCRWRKIQRDRFRFAHRTEEERRKKGRALERRSQRWVEGSPFMNRQARLHGGWTADIPLTTKLKKEKFSGLRREGEESGRVDDENRDAFRLWKRRTKLTSVNTKAFGRLGKVI